MDTRYSHDVADGNPLATSDSTRVEKRVGRDNAPTVIDRYCRVVNNNTREADNTCRHRLHIRSLGDRNICPPMPRVESLRLKGVHHIRCRRQSKPETRRRKLNSGGNQRGDKHISHINQSPLSPVQCTAYNSDIPPIGVLHGCDTFRMVRKFLLSAVVRRMP